MNRKQRRAMPSPQAGRALSVEAAAGPLFGEAVRHQHQGKLNEAIRLYKQVLALTPNHAEVWNNLGCVYLAQGKLKKARAGFERALVLMPELCDDFAGVCAMLVAVNPAIGEGMKRATAAWPRRLPARDLLGPSGVAAIAGDSVLDHVLQATTVRDVDLERLLTSIRLQILRTPADAAGDAVADDLLGFCCASAKQSLISEGVCARPAEGGAGAAGLKQPLVAALAQNADIPALWPTAVAPYVPLDPPPNAQSRLAGTWPAALTDVLTQ